VRRTVRWKRTVASLGVAVLVAGCGMTSGDPEAPGASSGDDASVDVTPAETETEEDAADEVAAEPVLRLVATVAPITDLVARVGGERVEVVSLVPAGADSHTYEPRPQDVAVLSEADAYLGVGLELNDGALDLAEQHLADGAPVLRLGELALDRSQLVLDHAHGDEGHSHGDDGHTHGDDDGHSHDDDGHAHGDDGHAHGDDELGPNPHVWTSVRNAISLVDAIAEQLTELDPEGAEHYAANAEALAAALDELDADIATAAATVPDANRTLVTYHDAWTYFARDHGFELVTAVQPGDYAEPSAAEVRQVIDLVRDLEVPAIFGSEVFPNRVVDAIAAETGATYVGDLADDTLPGEPGDDEHRYLELMRRNATTIVEALGGDAAALAR
jgi:ABC-type Zn uptake system ZnuABC Zn-binding protein ZnuA